MSSFQFVRYMHLNNGAPGNFNIRVTLVPNKRSIILAVKYPAGTTFTITKCTPSYLYRFYMDCVDNGSYIH